MALDLDRLRADTPGAGRRAHLNNAGAGLMPTPVLETVCGHLRREAQIGGYEAAFENEQILAGIYDSVARLIGASPDEIALVENATVAWQKAFYSLAFRPGDRILTARAEYAANYVAFLQVAQRTGAVIETVPDGPDGALCPFALEQMIDDRVRLIAITWIPSNGGLVNPAAAVGRIARAHGIPFLLDACQAVGQLPIDVAKIGCDMLSATGRKFLRGPRGTGFLYVRRELIPELEPVTIDHFAAPWTAPDRYELRLDARRFETWENNYAARLGLGAAVEYAMAVGLPEIQRRSHALAAHLRDELSTIPGVSIRDLGSAPSAIVSFAIEAMDAVEATRRIHAAGVNVSYSLPPITLLDSIARALPPLVRASPHYYNTTGELDALAGLVRKLAKA
jgi:cysteine desulfurase/selenocysteine lyase